MSPTKVAKRPKALPLLSLDQLPGEVIADVDLNGGLWFENAPDWPENADGGFRCSMDKWLEVAGEALTAMSESYDKNMAGKGRKDIQKVLNKEKTAADKIAVATLVVQESPLHRLDELNTLFSFIQKKGRHERSPAIDAFKDLLVNDLLPDGRRLLEFKERDFECGPGKLTKRHLGFALFEDELKSMIQRFLEVLDECAKDNVLHFKLKSVSVVFDLLAAKPEREKKLLAMLVNKLGDPTRRAASDAAYCLRKLVLKHSQMKPVLVREVERLIHRKNVGLRTQYYAISFLNQLRFQKSDVELARRLVSLYMSLVARCVDADKSKEVKKETGVDVQESRIMGAILTGVNRAFPYTEPESFDPSLGSNFDYLFRVAHAKSISSATQALAFLLQISKTNSTISDRFYRALYSRVEDLADAGESKQALLLNVILKGMKADVSAKRVKAFAKRLLQTAMRSGCAMAGAILVLLSEVLSVNHPGILKASLNENAEDADEEFVDIDSDDDEKEADPTSRTEIVKPANNDDSNLLYNISAREPLYARAERSALWELVALSAHYHPSVKKFAKEICSADEKVTYPSDPLSDFTLSAFLDKFCYKKPKKKVSDSLHGKRAVRISEALRLKNSKFFEEMRKGKEAEEDAFFGKFFLMNPGKLDVLEGVPVEDHKEIITANKDSDSEEEAAFEEAMHSEMRRLGAEVPIGEEGADVDDEDPDELAAFADAFKEEIDARDELLPMEIEDEVEQGTKNRGQTSVFAAQEDYADAIEEAERVEQEALGTSRTEKGEGKVQKRRKSSSRSARKRVKR